MWRAQVAKSASKSFSLLLPDLSHLLMLLHWQPRDALFIYIQPLTVPALKAGNFTGRNSALQRSSSPACVQRVLFAHSFSRDIIIDSKCAWQGSVPAPALNSSLAQTMEPSGCAAALPCQQHCLLLQKVNTEGGI